jgi:membrane fusion protein (multidrug efflux system)
MRPLASHLRNYAAAAGIAVASAAAIIAIGGDYGANAGTAPKAAAPPPTRVEVASAVPSPLVKTLQVVGDVESGEAVNLRSEVTGRIERIAFGDGALVKAGDLLIKLDGSVQEAELDRARANLNLWQNNAARYATLVQKGFVSKVKLEETQAELNLARANVKLAEANLAKTEIRAPFDSKVGIRGVSPGDYVSPGESLVNVDKTGDVKVRFTVPERFLHDLKQGVEVDLSSDALPGEVVKARIVAVESRVAADSRSLRVQAVAPNTDGKLYAGQFVTVSLPIRELRDALVIPDQALVPQGGETFVFRVEGRTAKRVAVKTGLRAESKAQIVAGLNADDLVVTAGHQKIQDGAPVEISRSTVVQFLATPDESDVN